MALLNFSNAWLQAAVCVGFFAYAVYTFGVTTGAIPSAWQDAFEASGAGSPALVNAYNIVTGLNYLAFAVLGAGCLLWPYLSSLFSKPSKHEGGATEAPASEQDVEAAQAAETNVAAPKPKRPKLFYLTHMKTFLTFIVVTQHVFNSGLNQGGAQGIYSLVADPSSVLYKLFAVFFDGANQGYFMAAFYLISAYFCPKSLDRKGFRDYVLDKLVRLGGGFLLYSVVLGPLQFMWTSAYAGGDVMYTPGNSNMGPTWFVFWLLNFSILYAIIAQVMPVIRFKMPNPVLLAVGGFAFGVVHLAVELTPIAGLVLLFDFDNMNKWDQGLSLYIPFFAAGIIGGRNGWLDSIENMSRWCKWTLRVIVGSLLILQLIDAFDVINWSSPHGLQWLQSGLNYGVYSVAMTLMQMQLFHEFLNINTKFLGAVGVAAYAVYIIHPWFLNFWTMIYLEILKAAHVPIIFSQNIVGSVSLYSTIDAAGQPASLSEGILTGGLIMVFVLTQLMVWPAAYYLRKLPVLNRVL